MRLNSGIYDPISNTWTTAPQGPVTRFGELLDLPGCGSAAAVKDLAAWIPARPTFSLWNDATSSWLQVDVPPIRDWRYGIFADDHRVYIWGSSAETSGNPYDPTGWVYDVSVGSWSELPSDRPPYPDEVRPTWTGCDALFVDVEGYPGEVGAKSFAFAYRP